MRVNTPMIHVLENLKERDLFIPNSNDWDIELSEELFTPHDINAIVKLLPGWGDGIDKVLWHYNKDGCYTVRSAYRLAVSMDDTVRYHVDGAWSNIWNADIPYKIQYFAWRLISSQMPSFACEFKEPRIVYR